MSKYTITPWRTPSDLLHVRSQLYPSPETSSKAASTSRLTAVNRIMAWKLRGNLPHAIESTALLMDAILHHQSQSPSSSISSFSIRAVYSAAFTRFVTGFCDIERSRERMLEPSSMLESAKKIGMPGEFVGLRHEATHEELPGLARLVKATEAALEWLWEFYWKGLGEDVEVDKVGSEESIERVREVLKAFRGERRLALKRKRAEAEDGEKQAGEERKTARICVGLVGGTEVGMNKLVQVFVQDKMLFPSKREIGTPLDGAYLLWDRLLNALLVKQKRFVGAFVKVLLEAIGNPATGDSDEDAEKEALCMWLVHTTSKKSWTAIASHELPALRKDMVMWCCTHPGYWSHYLGVHLIKGGGPDFADIWEDVLEASRLGDGYVGQAIMGDAEPEEAANRPVPGLFTDAGQPVQDDDGIRNAGGWRRAAASPTRPIGVVR